MILGIAIIGGWLLPIAGCSSNENEIRKSTGQQLNGIASQIAELPIAGVHNDVWGVDFSPNGNQIAVVAEPFIVKVWDWKKEQLTKTLEKPKNAGFSYLGSSFSSQIRYSNDGELLVSCNAPGMNDESIRIWGTSNWSVAASLYDKKRPRGGCGDIIFLDKGNEFLYIEDRVWEPAELVATSTKTWEENWALKFPKFTPGALAVDPTGRLIAIIGWHFDLHPSPKSDDERPKKSMWLLLVDAESHSVVKTIAVKMFELEDYESVAWSPDGKRFAISGCGHLQIFGADGEVLGAHAWEGAVHSRVMYSPDGRYLLESDSNGRGTGLGLRIWDYDHQRLLQSISGNTTSMSVSKDSQYLALGGLNKTSVWRLK